MTEWDTIKLPKKMAQKIEKFTKTNYAEERGFTSKSQVVVAAVRDFLQREQEVRFYLDSEKYKKKLPFKRISNLIFCELCKSEVCEHAIHLMKHKTGFEFEMVQDGEILAENPGIVNPNIGIEGVDTSWNRYVKLGGTKHTRKKRNQK